MSQAETNTLITCFGVRLGLQLLFPALTKVLDRTVEFSTPVTSYRSLQEGVFLMKKGLEVYDGGVVHHPPLLLAVFALFESCPDVANDVLYSLADTLIVYQLMDIARQFKLKIKPYHVGILYALNPLSVLGCISHNTTIFTHLAITSTLLAYLQGYTTLSGVLLAHGAYLSYHPFWLLIPLVALAGASVIVPFFGTLGLLLLLSYGLVGSTDFLNSTYGVIITQAKITPNLGLWWYFFTEMFDFFIPFFKAVFNMFNIVFITPYTLRFYKSQPFFAFVMCFGWLTLTKSYPSFSECAFLLAFIPFFEPVYGYLRYPVVSALLFIHSIVLAPIFYHLWVGLGSGNSNFFYAITLVYALAIASLMADMTWGMLRLEYDNGVPNPELKLTQL